MVNVISRFSYVRLLTAPWSVAHRLLCPWGFPGKNTGVDYHALQGIFQSRIEFRYLTSPALASSFFTVSATWEVQSNIYLKLIFVYVVKYG